MSDGRADSRRRSVFTLTEQEENLLVMIREGMTNGQMSEELGRPVSYRMMVAAVEKDRLRILRAAERDRPSALTTLAKARGTVQSDARTPTRGQRWK